jgi:23S rRNA (cytosine1962-C5)-methyltransferase
MSEYRLDRAIEDFERAWRWREGLGLFHGTEALRVFHGPGEGSSGLESVALDRYGDHYWVTVWGHTERAIEQGLCSFLRSKQARSAVVLRRPERGTPELPTALFGEPPVEAFSVREFEGAYAIRMRDTRHPGLFLDHQPLRRWLIARARGWRVLNAFAYTGSLSVAAAKGGASHVTTLDLSKPTIQWARENWALNAFSEERGRFLAGDVFDWLPRLAKKQERFDCVILDPPSFARGTRGTFSTAKDLPRLHELAIEVLAPGGFLISSINSADVSWSRFEGDVTKAARTKRLELQILSRVDLPETFPTRMDDSEGRYLKGFILRRS